MRASERIFRRQLLLSIGMLACMTGAAGAATPSAEFVSFHAAIVSQDKPTALAFIRGFPSSLLVDHLIKLLPREVAQQVCDDLPSGAARARDACRKANMRVVVRDLWGEPIDADQGDVAPEAPRGPARDVSEPAAGDTDTSAAAPAQELASARSSPAGTTGERTVDPAIVIVPPSTADSPATEEDDPAAPAGEGPKAKTAATEPDPGPAGKAPGALASGSSPSSSGAGPGSNSGSGSGGNAGRDSHN